MDATCWTAVGSVATGVGALLAGIGLLFTGWQISQSKRIARCDCLLHLEELLAKHTDINMRLRPSGDWGDGENGPKSDKEWADVEAYMGLFERVNALIDEGIIGIEYVEYFYGYRITNLANNAEIRSKKLQGDAAKYWTGFHKLEQKVNTQRNRRIGT
jgi:hypothetical protein